jgi:hypothetical protein
VAESGWEACARCSIRASTECEHRCGENAEDEREECEGAVTEHGLLVRMEW